MKSIRNILTFIGIASAVLCMPVWTAAQENGTIFGKVETPLGTALGNVTIEFNNGSQTYTITTDASGEYSQSVPPGSYYISQIGINNSDYLQGIDMSDLFAITQHIMGFEALNSPYKILAADVNYDKKITTIDLIQLRKLIFGISNTFTAPSWQFGPADYDFPIPTNPWFENIPFGGLIVVENGDTEYNIIGFKTGDVNWSSGLTGGLEGLVRADLDSDCTTSGGDPSLRGWIVMARQGNIHYFASTDSSGYYRLSVPPGDYELSLIPRNEGWVACQSDLLITIVENGYQNFDLSAQAQHFCPVPVADICAPFLRRCFDNKFSVYYANDGSVGLEDAYIEVEFDDFLEVSQSSLPWSSVSGNTYTFPIGDLAPGQWGEFEVTALLSCEAALGESHCTSAHIFPDSTCLPDDPAWDGAILKLSGDCDGDTLRFRIENIGADMQQATQLYVIEDDLIMFSGPLSLPSGGVAEINRPANGTTQRLVVEEPPGYPGIGDPTYGFEGCGTDGETGAYSMGFFTQFPEFESGSSASIYCTENIGAFDPNDKLAFPKGVGEEHFIEPGQPIDYLVRFQNTGTDTAFTVIIQDTLSLHLDPATLQMGATSHPFRWQLKDEGMLNIIFENILLPDSSANELASHGFVAFRIQQREELDLPTVITNKAAIYFDFNEPVITNEVFHTVDTNFLEIVVLTTDKGAILPTLLRLSPNPLQVGSPFQIAGALPENAYLTLYSTTGRLMATLRVQPGGIATLPAGTPAGWYLLELKSENQVIGRGKVVVGN